MRAAENGCRVAAGLDDLAAADIVVTMLPTGRIVRDLSWAKGWRISCGAALGSGHAMKALNNFVAAAGFAACAEALLTGQRFGLDPRRMVEILNVSTGRSFHTDLVLLEHVVDGKFASGFQLGLLAKDIGIADGLARDVGIDAPQMQLVRRRFDSARNALGYTRDNTEAIKAWDASR